MTTTLLHTLTRSCFRSLKKHTNQIRLESSFKAAVVKEGLKSLVIEERKRPKLKDDEVRVQVRYCSVNAADLSSFSDASREFPFTPGYELSGEVVEIGKNITKEQVLQGEKVAALSLDKFGGFAQECVLHINDVFRLPSNVALKDAVVLTSGPATAMLAFSKMWETRENDFVLITAGAAGYGLAAVEVAANVYKAKVIGVTDSEETGQLLRERGAFHTLKFSSKLQKQVYDVTRKRGVDIVYDAVGDQMLDSIGKCVASGGAIFYASPSGYKTIGTPPANCTLMIVSLSELRRHDLKLYRTVVNDTLELADQGSITGHVSAKFDFKDVNKAIEHIQQNKSTGKVVLKLED